MLCLAVLWVHADCEEHGLRVSENGVRGEISECKRQEVVCLKDIMARHHILTSLELGSVFNT